MKARYWMSAVGVIAAIGLGGGLAVKMRSAELDLQNRNALLWSILEKA